MYVEYHNKYYQCTGYNTGNDLQVVENYGDAVFEGFGFTFLGLCFVLLMFTVGALMSK